MNFDVQNVLRLGSLVNGCQNAPILGAKTRKPLVFEQFDP